MNMLKTLYYKRVIDRPILKTGDPNNLDVGDVLRFFGKLYRDESRNEEVADTVIEYEILLLKDDGSVLMHTSNEYIFNNLGGALLFEGRILSHSFNIIEGKVQSYTTEPAILSLMDGTDNFTNSYGLSHYKMIGEGLGVIVIDINTL
jgi:hypothetical protein